MPSWSSASDVADWARTYISPSKDFLITSPIQDAQCWMDVMDAGTLGEIRWVWVARYFPRWYSSCLMGTVLYIPMKLWMQIWISRDLHSLLHIPLLCYGRAPLTLRPDPPVSHGILSYLDILLADVAARLRRRHWPIRALKVSIILPKVGRWLAALLENVGSKPKALPGRILSTTHLRNESRPFRALRSSSASTYSYHCGEKSRWLLWLGRKWL
jgi:hypothetical protein